MLASPHINLIFVAPMTAVQDQLTKLIPISLAHSGNFFLLQVGDETIRQSTCEFMLTFSSLVGTDIEAYLSNVSPECDIVRVPLSGRGNFIDVPLCDFARLRRVYGQMMFELKLQDLLLRSAILPPMTPAFAE